MVTKREYLIQRGLAKEGRGRLSAAAHDAIKKAINDGMKFDEPDKNTKTVTVKTKDEKGRTVVTTKRVNDVVVVADPRESRHQGQYTFQNPDGTKFKRLHTNACAKCNYSFQWCWCVGGPFQFPYPSKPGQDGLLAQCVGTPSPQREAKPTKAKTKAA